MLSYGRCHKTLVLHPVPFYMFISILCRVLNLLSVLKWVFNSVFFMLIIINIIEDWKRDYTHAMSEGAREYKRAANLRERVGQGACLNLLNTRSEFLILHIDCYKTAKAAKMTRYLLLNRPWA